MSKIFICDFARVTDNGTRFDVIGAGTEVFNVPNLPSPIFFAVFVELNFPKSKEKNKHFFEIHISDSDGKHASPPITGEVELSKKQTTTYAAFNMQMLIKKSTKLSLILFVDENKEDTVLIRVNEESNGD